MAEFGKRQRSQSTQADSRRAAPTADFAGAAAMIAAGQVPSWAKVSRFQLTVILLISATAFWFMIFPYAGNLVRDLRLAGTWQPAYDLRVTEGRCTRFHFLITTCKAKIASLPNPTEAPQAVAYMMAFTGGGGERLVAIRSTVDPTAVTIGYAAETELMNRTLTFLAMSGGLVIASLAVLTALMRGRYVGGTAHRALLSGYDELVARAEQAHAGPRAAV